MPRHVALAFLLATTVLCAGPINVSIAGNFGPPSTGSSVFDNQNYFITFMIADPHSPDMAFDAPGGIGQVSATYHVPVLLAVPGLGFSVMNPMDVSYIKQAPLGIWMNIFTFTGLPVGDFMVVTPLQTISGVPLWNGLAGSLGQPEINFLNAEPSSTRFFLEQNVPNMGALPIAVYDNGRSSITVIAVDSVPEPSTISVAPAAVLAFVLLRRVRTRRIVR